MRVRCARDAGIPIAAQVLTHHAIDRRCNGASKTERAKGYPISPAAVKGFRDHALARAKVVESPLASPLNAQDLPGAAPPLVLTAEYDPSRDESFGYCDALRAAGNRARHAPLPGRIRGAFWMSGAIPRTSEMLAAMGGFLGEQPAAQA